jgi:hypothetical protein
MRVLALAGGGHYAQACFFAHQVAETSLKAAAYLAGAQTQGMLRHHQLVKLAFKDGACAGFCIATAMLTFPFVLLSGGGPGLVVVVTASKLGRFFI